MISYVVTQALTTVLGSGQTTPVGTTFHVQKPRDSRLLYTAVAVVGSTPPRYRLLDTEGRELGALTSNFVKSRYELLDGTRSIATLAFPAVAFEKSVLLTVGGELVEGEGGVFRGVFTCRRPDGELVLEIARELSIRDRFLVKAADDLPLAVPPLAAVAIHSRFYEMV